MKTKNLTTFFTFTSLLLGLYTFGISRAEVSQATEDATPSVQTKKEKATNYGYFIGLGTQGTKYQVKDTTTVTTPGLLTQTSSKSTYNTTGNFVTIGYKTRPRFIFGSISLEVGESGFKKLEFADSKLEYNVDSFYTSMQLTLGLQLLKNFAIYGIAGYRLIALSPKVSVGAENGVPGGDGRSQSASKNFDAFFLGAGLEFEIIPHLTLFTEYTFATNKRGKNMSGDDVREEAIRRTTNVALNIRQLETIKGGLKYYF